MAWKDLEFHVPVGFPLVAHCVVHLQTVDQDELVNLYELHSIISRMRSNGAFSLTLARTSSSDMSESSSSISSDSESSSPLSEK